jgi:hypothetical protein
MGTPPWQCALVSVLGLAFTATIASTAGQPFPRSNNNASGAVQVRGKIECTSRDAPPDRYLHQPGSHTTDTPPSTPPTFDKQLKEPEQLQHSISCEIVAARSSLRLNGMLMNGCCSRIRMVSVSVSDLPSVGLKAACM